MLRKTTQSNYDKIRDELIEIKSDYKAWLRSLKILWVAVSIILFILAFFGYSKIESIEKTIFERVELRLKTTDSLLAQIDKRRIDSLNKIISEKEVEYKSVIANFENTIRKNKELELKLLNSLVPNKRIEYNLTSYYKESSEGYLKISEIPKSINQKSSLPIYLIFLNNEAVQMAEVINVSVTYKNDKGEIISTGRYFYEINGVYNKAVISFDLPKRRYDVEIGFIAKVNGNKYNYSQNYSIDVN